MNVSRVAVVPFCIPLRRPFRVGGREIAERVGALIRLQSDCGLEGLGEVCVHPLAPPGHAHAALQMAREAAAALVRGGPIGLGGMESRVAAVPSAPVRAGLEMACCDLAARAAGVSVGAHLGRVERASIAVNAVVDCVDPGGAAAAARACVEQGHRCIKLKAAPGDVGAEAARLAAVREAVGPEIALRLDANGAWAVPDAIARIRRLARYDLEYVEQPVARIIDLMRVRRAVETRIAADESATGPGAVEEVAELKAADVVVIKPALLGLCAAELAMSTARRCGLAVVVTSAMDTSIGIAAAAHLAATAPDPLPACGLATASLLAGDLVRRPLVPCNGRIDVPLGPGLGVEVDEAACSRWARR